MKKTSILTVNGGKDPTEGRWLILFLEKLYAVTDSRKFNLTVWNNNTWDEEIGLLQKKYDFDLLEPLANDQMFHPHAVPLQRLYNYAVNAYNPDIIIVMDSDAFPIKKGWFEELTGAIASKEYILAGIWRDELVEGITPYVHPSCMCFSTEFVKENNLRLDFYEINTETQKHDTLSAFTDKAQEHDNRIFKWRRINVNNFHRLMGGIYGDYVYHHGAGSRDHISFWDEGSDPEKRRLNKRINLNASHLLFNNFETYISWLKGENVKGDLESFISSRDIDHDKNGKAEKSSGTLSWIKQKIVNKTSRSQKEVKNATKEFFDNMKGIPSENDFNRLTEPLGWEFSFPDIVGIGVPKAGTSWWFDNLLSHPHIVPHRFYDQKMETSKELHFFTHIGHQLIDERQKEIYRKCFLKQEGVICAEFSTIYFQHIGSLNNLLRTVGDSTVFVLILRNPVDRYISQINHIMLNRTRRLGINDTDNRDFFRKYSVVPEAAYYSLYADSLEYLMSKVGRERIYVDTYENFSKSPEKAYRDFIDFLALPQYYLPTFDYTKPKNIQEYIIAKPTDEERAGIADRFRSDVSKLGRILPELKLDEWQF